MGSCGGSFDPFRVSGFREALQNERDASTSIQQTPRSGSLFYSGERRASAAGELDRTPSFVEWLCLQWPDIILLTILGGISLLLWRLPPPLHRYFALGDSIDNAAFAHPVQKMLIPPWLAGLLTVGVPVIAFAVLQVRIRSFWDWNNATLGVIYALILSTAFQCFVKWLIGGFRPNWLAMCQPDPKRMSGVGFGSMFYTSEICTNTNIRGIADSQQSFVSGHTSAAFASFLFLSLYLNAKLKVIANYEPRLWKIVVIATPILGAVLMAGVVVREGSHHWYDAVAGGIIGTAFALLAYRVMYAAIFDFRFNHIPLLKTHPFKYRTGGPYDCFHETVLAKRKGFWDDPERWMDSGAPFDAGLHTPLHTRLVQFGNLSAREEAALTKEDVARILASPLARPASNNDPDAILPVPPAPPKIETHARHISVESDQTAVHPAHRNTIGRAFSTPTEAQVDGTNDESMPTEPAARPLRSSRVSVDVARCSNQAPTAEKNNDEGSPAVPDRKRPLSHVGLPSSSAAQQESKSAQAGKPVESNSFTVSREEGLDSSRWTKYRSALRFDSHSDMSETAPTSRASSLPPSARRRVEEV